MTAEERDIYEREIARWEQLRLMAGCVAGVEADIEKAATQGEPYADGSAVSAPTGAATEQR